MRTFIIAREEYSRGDCSGGLGIELYKAATVADLIRRLDADDRPEDFSTNEEGEVDEDVGYPASLTEAEVVDRFQAANGDGCDYLEIVELVKGKLRPVPELGLPRE